LVIVCQSCDKQAASLSERDSGFAHYFAQFWGLGLLLGNLATVLLVQNLISYYHILARRPQFPIKSTKFCTYLA